MNKKYVWLLGIVAVVIVVFVLTKSGPSPLPVEDKTASTTAGAAIGTSSTSSGAPSAASSPKAAAYTYTEAIKIYATRRIQIDQNCQLLPNSIVFKSPVDVMFDNRSNSTKVFYLNGKRYSLAAYGFSVLHFTSTVLPHTIVIDCGTGKNNGQIILN